MKITTLLLLLVSAAVFSQETDRFEINGLWKFQLLHPVHFGDNALAKGYDSDLGFGLEIGLFKYNNLRFGIGYNIVQYKVTDTQMIGNIRNGNYTSIYGSFSYEYQIIDAISVIPNIGYGYAKLANRSSSKSFGSQDGNEFRVGLTGNYNFTKFSSVYIGVQFIHTTLDVKTAPEYVDYFGKMNQIQLAVGVQFD